MITEILTDNEFKQLSSEQKLIYTHNRKVDVMQYVIQSKDKTIEQLSQELQERERRIEELETRNNIR